MIAFFILLLKSLYGSQVGMKNVRTYLYWIYCKVKTKIQGERCHTLRSRCACVWNIYVANLILLFSLETCLSYFELKNFARAYGLSFHTFFFFSFFIFLLTWTLVHFSYTLFLHSHIPFSCTWNLKRRQLQRTQSIYS
jgi:hypothetical protein